jgi:glycosyltransferase involved in cell wall biosynthesis/putative flippase GtrA
VSDAGNAGYQKSEAVRVVAMVGRFAVGGAACSALNIAIMFVGTVVVGINYVATALLTCLITIPLSYLFHRRITFRITPAWGGEAPEFLRFVISQFVQFGAGLCVLVILVEWVGFTPIWGMVVMTALMFGYGFVVNSTWVFQRLKLPFAHARVPASSKRDDLRLLQVSAFFPSHGGGIEAVADRIARGIAAAGIHVHWMAGGATDEQPTQLESRLTVDRASSIDFVERRLGLPSPIWSLGSLRRLWLAVRHCDVVHVHDFLYMPTLVAMCFAGLVRKPVVLTQHIGPVAFQSLFAKALLVGLHHSLGRLAMRLASQVVFVGRPVMVYFERFVNFRRPPLLIANGVDHGLYHPLAERAVGNDLLRCLFVGRFVEKKGLALLEQCVDLPGLHWTFVGWGPMSPRDWGAHHEHVEVHGRLCAEQIVPYFQSADLFVLPSTGEGFPLVVQEALACGTPVLVSAEVAEAFPAIDPSCVFAVELRTPNAASVLRNRLQSLAQQRLVIAQVRQSAVTLARQWSWKNCVDQYCEVYRNVAGAATRGLGRERPGD